MSKHNLKIAIIGAGPSGGILGAFLAQKNPDIVLVDVWQTHIDAIKNNGLKIVGQSGQCVISMQLVGRDQARKF